MPFEGLQCSCLKHGEIAGSYKGVLRSMLAQTWPLEMCKTIVEGVCAVVRKVRQRRHMFPVADGQPL